MFRTAAMTQSWPDWRSVSGITERISILDGKLPLYVDGYSTAGQDEAENLAMSRVRSNRVKSELIVRQKLTEDCFITKNHSGSGDYVTVRIVIPAEKDEAEEARLAAERAEQERIAAEQAKQQQLEQQKQEQERIAREKEQARLAAEQAKADSLAAEQEKAEAERLSAGKAEDADSYTLSLRANLLRWATPGGALVSGREESLVCGRDVQGRTVQLQVLRHGQAGRSSGRRHHRRLPATAEQGTGT